MVRAMLTDADQIMLDLEGTRWKYPGAKEARALHLLGMSATRYYQRLNVLIDEPAAEAAHPTLVRRLRRLRDARRAQRTRRLVVGSAS